MIDEFRQRFGKFAIPVWLICGLAAFGIFMAGAMRFTPELARSPTDWIVWLLDALLFLTCLFGGPGLSHRTVLILYGGRLYETDLSVRREQPDSEPRMECWLFTDHT